MASNKVQVNVLPDQHRYFPLLWASHSAATVYTMGEQTGNGKRYWSNKIMLLETCFCCDSETSYDRHVTESCCRSGGGGGGGGGEIRLDNGKLSVCNLQPTPHECTT
jgi:hypothetical protein